MDCNTASARNPPKVASTRVLLPDVPYRLLLPRNEELEQRWYLALHFWTFAALGEFPVFKDILARWPLLQQIRTGSDGTGAEAMTQRTRDLASQDGWRPGRPLDLPLLRRRLRSVGLPQSGQADFNRRRSAVAHLARTSLPEGRRHLRTAHSSGAPEESEVPPPYSRTWEEIDLETAMDMVADRVWDTRERTFEETHDGQTLMQTTAIAHLGGATLDNEENYLIKKLFTAGLGMVCISNQARI